MSKVRPMVDKDLRDYIISYHGGVGSFNSALKNYVKVRTGEEYFASTCNGTTKMREKQIHSLHGKVKQRDRQIIELEQEIEKSHNEKLKIYKWASEVSQHNSSLMDEVSGDRWRSIERARLSMYRGVAIGLIVGLSFGHLFL